MKSSSWITGSSMSRKRKCTSSWGPNDNKILMMTIEISLHQLPWSSTKVPLRKNVYAWRVGVYQQEFDKCLKFNIILPLYPHKTILKESKSIVLESKDTW